MLVLSCDDVPRTSLRASGRHDGIDVGIASYDTTSDGEHIENPRWARAAADRLTAAQRRLQRAAAAATTVGLNVKESLHGIARSLTSARTFSTN